MYRKSRGALGKDGIQMVEKDWLHYKIKNIARVIRGASPRPKGDKRYYGGDIPRLMVEDVTRDGKFVTPQVDFLTKEGEKLSRPCKKGTLTIVCSGTVGIPSFLAVDACIHDGFLALIEIDKNISNDYLYHQLSSLRNKFESSATHGGVFTNLTTSILEEFTVAFPPTKEEQSVIAESLSNIDELIQQLDYLIQKKKNIKQGAMQELLTGKRRLEGFSGKWKNISFNDAFYITAGRDLDKISFSESQDDRHPFPIYSNSLINSGLYGFSSKFQYEKESITITARGIVGKANARSHKYSAIGRVLILKPIQKLDCFFVAEYINNKIKFSIESTGVPQLTKPQISKYLIDLPELDEQLVISNILSDMDSEIQELKQNRDKYIMIKQGMMQKLLTGEIRVK